MRRGISQKQATRKGPKKFPRRKRVAACHGQPGHSGACARLARESGRLLALATERLCSPRSSRKRTKRAISAKALIHQKHVDIVHAALEPSAVKRRWAEGHGSIFP